MCRPEGGAGATFRLCNTSMINRIPENKHPLWMYVIGVLVVFDRERFATFAHVCGGFLLGMFAMYIAMHVYSWK